MLGELHRDRRGYLMEFANEGGQVFVARSHPGMVRGNHYHLRKSERFTVLEGSGLLSIRKRGTNVIHEHWLTGDRPEIVTVQPGEVHAIVNEGAGDMVLVAWASEIFDPTDPDTYSEEV